MIVNVVVSFNLSVNPTIEIMILSLFKQCGTALYMQLESDNGLAGGMCSIVRSGQAESDDFLLRISPCVLSIVNFAHSPTTLMSLVASSLGVVDWPKFLCACRTWPFSNLNQLQLDNMPSSPGTVPVLTPSCSTTGDRTPGTKGFQPQHHTAKLVMHQQRLRYC